MTESRFASFLRRVAGWVPLVALPAACLTLDMWTVVVVATITVVCIPSGMMILHLNLTRSLREWEKDVWREELRARGPWWSRSYREHYRVLIGAWTYVHAPT